MKIAVIGTGYVGLVTGACLAGMGNEVACVDVDTEKLALLEAGVVPFYEPGLENIIKANQKAGLLRFTDNLDTAIDGAGVCFITVGTPSDVDGSADLQYVLEVASQIGAAVKNHMLVVTKSTVPVGTAALVAQAMAEQHPPCHVSVASNPEFLREGSAVNDFLHPDRVVIGADSEHDARTLREVYSFVPQEKIISVDVRSSEMTKYAANALLATKISFMNEMAHICELVGADIEKVRLGVGSDCRIGYSFISPGCGFGGSCFPKDVRALRYTALKKGYTPRILQAVDDVNEAQKHVIFQKALKHYGQLHGKIFAIWGLSFKPNTSDVREASSLVIVHDMLGAGATLRLHDPVAMEEAAKYLGHRANLELAENHYDALKGANGLILVTEWDMYKQPDFKKMKNIMAEPVIFDGRNQYPPREVRELGFTYHSIGRQ